MSESGQLAREQLPSSAESPLLAIEGGSSPTASHHSTDATQPGPPGDPGLLPVAAYARADSQGDLSSASSFKVLKQGSIAQVASIASIYDLYTEPLLCFISACELPHLQRLIMKA